jgi:hypothetical protein
LLSKFEENPNEALYGSCCSILASGALLGHAGNAHADIQDQNLISIDRSASMADLSTNTKTKYVVMKEKVNEKLDSIAMRTNRTQHFEIRTFNGTGWQTVRSFSPGTVSDIRPPIVGLGQPMGDTPLAGASAPTRAMFGGQRSSGFHISELPCPTRESI